MTATDAKFQGSIPAIYDSHLVPMLFEPYAADLVARCGPLENGVVIEVAAGTGVVTRALAQKLAPAVTIVATDLNEAMLEIAARQLNEPRVTWRQADAQALPFEGASALAVVCQFGLMFVPKRVVAYAEARRVLTPGGRCLFNVWDRLGRNEVSEIVSRSVAALFPADPPLFIERTPFGYFDTAVIRAELRSAGFERIEIETVEKVTRAPSAEFMAVGLCQGTPLRNEIEARDPTRLGEATRVATEALSARFGSGAFDNQMSAHVVTAWR